MSHLSSFPAGLQQHPPTSDKYESEIEAVLLALKAAAIRATEKRDVTFYAEYLSEDAIGVTPQGVLNKQQILESLKHGGFRSSKIGDSRAIALSDDAGMVTYRAWIETPEWPAHEVFVTTFYRRYSDGWKGVFYQLTPLPGDK
jgi:peptidoglycan/xylan/chitin deacetylase (PgdA/CDA1 family)